MTEEQTPFERGFVLIETTWECTDEMVDIVMDGRAFRNVVKEVEIRARHEQYCCEIDVESVQNEGHDEVDVADTVRVMKLEQMPSSVSHKDVVDNPQEIEHGNPKEIPIGSSSWEILVWKSNLLCRRMIK
ncbi:hypothetical protein V6N13_043793 [Hibiscus sabdariffa]